MLVIVMQFSSRQNDKRLSFPKKLNRLSVGKTIYRLSVNIPCNTKQCSFSVFGWFVSRWQLDCWTKGTATSTTYLYLSAAITSLLRWWGRSWLASPQGSAAMVTWEMVSRFFYGNSCYNCNGIRSQMTWCSSGSSSSNTITGRSKFSESRM